MNVQQLENELWEAADQLRANSKLTAAEYSMPVLGLIFLRHADNRFQAYLPEIEADIPPQVPVAQREELIKLGFQGKAAIYLPEAARFDRIASLPQGASVGEAIDVAMDVIEADYEVLKGALPRGYTAFEPDLLAELVKIFDRPAIKAATGDVFGRIYEYPLIQQVRLIKKRNQQLTQTRDLLLPKLMSGQLDVFGIPLPEEVAA